MNKVGFVFDEIFLRHQPPSWHPDSGRRLLAIMDALTSSGLLSKLLMYAPRSATFEELTSVHSPDYINQIRSCRPGALDADTYLSEDSFQAAACSAGAVIEAVERARQGEARLFFCAVRPPGHHAETSAAMGFCIINNIAVGARYAGACGYKRIFIVDFDAHHGNGTQHIFEADDSVFYFSTHQYPCYPETGKDMERGTGKGEGYTYNLPIPAGSGNREFLYVYQDILPGLLQRFCPELVLVSAGYDIHADDPHADIRVSNEGVRAIVQSILACTPAPVIFVLEGGYHLPSLAECVRITIEEMLKEVRPPA